MEKNVGSSDKILRIVVGIALVIFANFGPDTGYNVWGWIGLGNSFSRNLSGIFDFWN